MECAILLCGCRHPFQDAVYGRQKRVYNPTQKETVFRCSVCGITRDSTSRSMPAIIAPKAAHHKGGKKEGLKGGKTKKQTKQSKESKERRDRR